MVETDTATVPAVRDGTDVPAISQLLQLQLLIVTAAVHRSLYPNLAITSVSQDI